MKNKKSVQLHCRCVIYSWDVVTMVSIVLIENQEISSLNETVRFIQIQYSRFNHP